jgi:hypothetical protein
VWCAAGEANLPWYQAKNFPADDRTMVPGWTAVLRHIRTTDPFRRPLTIHPTAINRYNARHVTDDLALLDFDFLQTPHGQREAVPVTVRAARESFAASPTLPVINGEAAYEMLGDKLPTEWTRAMFWLCLTNGAAGHTYGANGIWQLNRKGEPHGPVAHGEKPADRLRRDRLGRGDALARLAADGARQRVLRISAVDANSHRWEAASGGPDSPCGCRRKTHFSRRKCAALATVLRVIYVLAPRAATVRALRASARYAVTYFDPVTGERHAAPPITANAQGEVAHRASAAGARLVVLLEVIDSGKAK